MDIFPCINNVRVQMKHVAIFIGLMLLGSTVVGYLPVFATPKVTVYSIYNTFTLLCLVLVIEFIIYKAVNRKDSIAKALIIIVIINIFSWAIAIFISGQIITGLELVGNDINGAELQLFIYISSSYYMSLILSVICEGVMLKVLSEKTTIRGTI